jgi:signal transduction histidine kinase
LLNWLPEMMRQASHVRALALVLAPAAISLLQWVIPDRWVLIDSFFRHLYVVPIVISALYYGRAGGLLAAGLSALCHAPNVIGRLGVAPQMDEIARNAAEFGDLLLVGVVAGYLSEKERKQKHNLERTSATLEKVYRELQQNFEHLKRSEKLYAIGQLSAGFAHEIRNPLAGIAGAAGILQRGQASRERQAECVAIINREAQRMEGLLASFLNFARPRPPQYRLVEPASVIASVVELAAHAIDRQPISLRTHVEAGMPALECDPEQFQQVLLNLCINAFQAMPEGGEALISARLEGPMAAVSVRDQGCGLDPQLLDRIFDPFFTTKENGTGLGLSVAFQIMERHGGSLTAHINADRGMTFTARLPLQRREAA